MKTTSKKVIKIEKKLKIPYTFHIGDKKIVVMATDQREAINLLQKLNG